MGTSTYMAMNSIDPTWAEKVRSKKRKPAVFYCSLLLALDDVVKNSNRKTFPEIHFKVELAVLLAPIAFVDHMNSPIKVELSTDLRKLLNQAHEHRYHPKQNLSRHDLPVDRTLLRPDQLGGGAHGQRRVPSQQLVDGPHCGLCLW